MGIQTNSWANLLIIYIIPAIFTRLTYCNRVRHAVFGWFYCIHKFSFTFTFTNYSFCQIILWAIVDWSNFETRRFIFGLYVCICIRLYHYQMATNKSINHTFFIRRLWNTSRTIFVDSQQQSKNLGLIANDDGMIPNEILRTVDSNPFDVNMMRKRIKYDEILTENCSHFSLGAIYQQCIKHWMSFVVHIRQEW